MVIFLIRNCVPDPILPLVPMMMFLSSNSIACTLISICDGVSLLPVGTVNALVALKKSPSSVINLVFATKFNSSSVVL